MRSTRKGSAQSGFTLIELLVVIALIAILTLIGLPWLLGTLNRAKLVGAAKETATLFQVARLEAIKQNRNTFVQYDSATDSIFAFVDLDGDGAFTDGTDRYIVQNFRLPKGVAFQGPTDVGPGLANAIDGWDVAASCADELPGPIFRVDGSANCAGAFRFGDQMGNFLETRVEFPATGKVVIQKWFGGGDPNANWYENGEANQRWTW